MDRRVPARYRPRSRHRFADLIDGPLARIPSGRFGANPAWIMCAAIAHKLLLAAGVLAGHRLARPQHRPIPHLPSHWLWSKTRLALWRNTIGHGPPLPATPWPPAGRPHQSTQEKLDEPAATSRPHPDDKDHQTRHHWPDPG